MNDYNRSNTIEDILRRYDLEGMKRDRNRIYTIQGELTNTEGILNDFVDLTTKDLGLIKDQLDGNVSSWFYNYDPTLNNVPAVDWNTDELKEEHLEDLFYNADSGKVYKFVKENNTYQWIEITNIVGAQSLAIANASQDTEDHNRRTFFNQPVPPYDTGDLWCNNTTHNLYRCVISKATGQSFESQDWVDSLRYTDNSYAIAVENEMRTSYATKTELTRTEDSINASVKALRVSTDPNHTIYNSEPTVPYKVGDVYIYNTGTSDEVYNCIADKSTGTFDWNDWELDVDLTDYVSEAGISIFQNSINMIVEEKIGVNGEKIVSTINQTPQTIKLSAQKILLDGYVGTSGGFNIDNSGNMSCNNATINGDLITSKGVLTNLIFPAESWGWTYENGYDGYNANWVGWNVNLNNDNFIQSYLNFSIRIPPNFIVESAKIILRHSPMEWGLTSGSVWGSCKNLKLYKTTGLGQIGHGFYNGWCTIGGNTPSFGSPITSDNFTFNTSGFTESISSDFKSSLNSGSGTYNIVVKSSDSKSTSGVDFWNNDSITYRIGPDTGILTGYAEIIGYLKTGV